MKPCRFILMSIFALLVSCKAQESPVVFNEKIVVEGFIEQGRTPVVWLSRSLYVPYGNADYGEEDIRRIPIRLAKVTVRHGEQEEILVSEADSDNILGWRYSGRNIRGEQGEEYTLTVEYSGYVLTATTTIPAPARLGDITCDNEKGAYRIRTSIEGASPEGYYMLMSRVDNSGVYNPCLFGTVAGGLLEGKSRQILVFRPMAIKLEDESYSPVWNPGESVSLRLASIGRGSFEFWNGFLEDVINAHNPIYPSSANLPSNIEGGGLGIWYGFSADYGEILLPESPSNSM